MTEVRVCEVRAEAPAGADSLVLTGTPVIYDVPTLINDPAGAYTEVIRRGALDCADLNDARLLYNHDRNRVPLARTPKTMQLVLTPAGLNMVAQLPATEEGRGVHTAVSRGDLTGMSFAFVVPPGGDEWDAGAKTRAIVKIEKIVEVSVVPFPAYPQASVEARSKMQNLDTVERRQAILALNKILAKEFV